MTTRVVPRSDVLPLLRSPKQAAFIPFFVFPWKMSTRFFSASTCKRFFLRLALVFFFSLPASNVFGGEYTQILGDIKDETSSSSASLLDIDSILQNEFPSTVSGGNSASLRSESLKYYLWRMTRAVDTIRDRQTNNWLRLFLTGRSDGVANNVPRFRTLNSFDGYPPDQAFWTVNGQSLQDFLSLTLGGFVMKGLGPYQMTFDTAWSEEFGYLPMSGDTPITAGYNFFTIWLAEAQRRLINNTTLTNADWRAVNMSSNPVQVVTASLQSGEHDFSNLTNTVEEAEEELHDFFDDSMPSNSDYDTNTSDDTLPSLSIGPDDGAVSSLNVIRLASSTDISTIVAQSGLSYSGPHMEISLSSVGGGSLSSAISSVNSVMVTVWNWVRSLAIMLIAISWYRRVRSLLLSSQSVRPDDPSGSPFRF